MGPIGGIILVDYYLVQKMKLRISDLYTRSPLGAYYYSKGFNVAAILPVVPGFLQKVGIVTSIPNAFVVVYNNAWFISFFSAGFLYWVLLSLRRKTGESAVIDPLLPDAKWFMDPLNSCLYEHCRLACICSIHKLCKTFFFG